MPTLTRRSKVSKSKSPRSRLRSRSLKRSILSRSTRQPVVSDEEFLESSISTENSSLGGGLRGAFPRPGGSPSFGKQVWLNGWSPTISGAIDNFVLRNRATFPNYIEKGSCVIQTYYRNASSFRSERAYVEIAKKGINPLSKKLVLELVVKPYPTETYYYIYASERKLFPSIFDDTFLGSIKRAARDSNYTYGELLTTEKGNYSVALWNFLVALRIKNVDSTCETERIDTPGGPPYPAAPREIPYIRNTYVSTDYVKENRREVNSNLSFVLTEATAAIGRARRGAFGDSNIDENVV